MDCSKFKSTINNIRESIESGEPIKKNVDEISDELFNCLLLNFNEDELKVILESEIYTFEKIRSLKNKAVIDSRFHTNIEDFSDGTPKELKPKKRTIIDEINKQKNFPAILELIDNSIDAISSSKKDQTEFKIELLFQEENGIYSLIIIDEGSGMKETQQNALATLGFSFKEDIGGEYIGTWGSAFTISAFRLGKRVKVFTRPEDSAHFTIRISFPDDYIKDPNDDNWSVTFSPFKGTNDPNPLGFTRVEIEDLTIYENDINFNTKENGPFNEVKEEIEEYLSKKITQLKDIHGKILKITVYTPSGAVLPIKAKSYDFLNEIFTYFPSLEPVKIEEIPLNHPRKPHLKLYLRNVILGIAIARTVETRPIGLWLWGNDRLFKKKLIRAQKDLFSTHLKFLYVNRSEYDRFSGQLNFYSQSLETNIFIPWARPGKREINFLNNPFYNDFEKQINKIFAKLRKVLGASNPVLYSTMDLFNWDIINEVDENKRIEKIIAYFNGSESVEIKKEEAKWFSDAVSKFKSVGLLKIITFKTIDEFDDDFTKKIKDFEKLLKVAKNANSLTARNMPEKIKFFLKPYLNEIPLPEEESDLSTGPAPEAKESKLKPKVIIPIPKSKESKLKPKVKAPLPKSKGPPLAGAINQSKDSKTSKNIIKQSPTKKSPGGPPKTKKKKVDLLTMKDKEGKKVSEKTLLLIESKLKKNPEEVKIKIPYDTYKLLKKKITKKKEREDWIKDVVIENIESKFMDDE